MPGKPEISVFEQWSLVIMAAGFAAVIVQLLLQRWQTGLLIKTLDASISVSVAQRQLEVDRLFVEKPHLVGYFLEGVQPDADHRQEAEAAAMLLLNYFDTYFL